MSEVLWMHRVLLEQFAAWLAVLTFGAFILAARDQLNVLALFWLFLSAFLYSFSRLGHAP